MTCSPGGVPGLPICSACQFAIQFYPLAALKVTGRPLFWWTPDHAWMYQLTSGFARTMNRLIEGSPDQVPSLPWPSTRLLDEVEAALQHAQADLQPRDLVGCHATNYGSGPDYQEIRIHRGLIEFIRYGQGHPVYRAIREDGWKSDAPKSKKKATAEEMPLEMRRNNFYEDLGKFLRDADTRDSGIVRRYFTKHARGSEGTFELAAVFTRKVLGMTQEQIDAIKELADRMSDSRKAAGHLDRLFERRGLTNYIRAVADISDRMVRAGESAIPLESVLRAFNMASEDDTFARDASLVRELILLRIIEKLPSDRVPETKLEETEE
jgi:CRISPR-associated protein Cst1